jgi:transketolase
MKYFGASGPYKKLYEYFGITTDNLIKMIKNNI